MNVSRRELLKDLSGVIFALYLKYDQDMFISHTVEVKTGEISMQA